MSKLSRREVVAGLLATGCAAACASVPTFEARSLPLRVPLRQFDKEGRVVINHNSLPYPIFVQQRGEDEFLALRMECTHKGCPLVVRKDKLWCSCHGSKFSSDGEALTGPAELPLPRYDATRDGDEVVIQLG